MNDECDDGRVEIFREIYRVAIDVMNVFLDLLNAFMMCNVEWVNYLFSVDSYQTNVHEIIS